MYRNVYVGEIPICFWLHFFLLLIKYIKVMKYILDLNVVAVEHLHERYVLIRLTHEKPLPPMLPGQFVEVRVDGSPTTFLRRAGDRLNCVLPLGNTFTLPDAASPRLLLVGGCVGVAPLLFMGKRIKEAGFEPTFLLGARSSRDLLELDSFKSLGRVFVTTEDGSEGERGFVTDHSLLCKESFDRIATCGPLPMMQAVARYAHKAGVECEVSLENKMACGIGACLCCVEKTTSGNVCVCKEGPVINTKKLTWQI